LVRRLLRPGDTFIDAGANFGYFTLLGSRLVGPTGRVIAFEPSPATLVYLKKNLDLNPSANIVLHECALMDRLGNVRINRISDRNSGANTIRTIDQPLETWEVAAVRLEDVIPATERIRLLKLDVEGAELLVIKGFLRHLREGLVAYVLCEVHDILLRELGSSSTEFCDLMMACGYQPYDFERKRLCPLPALAPTTLEKQDQLNVLFVHRDAEPVT
jgi:FkbM family methyltransferase